MKTKTELNNYFNRLFFTYYDILCLNFMELQLSLADIKIGIRQYDIIEISIMIILPATKNSCYLLVFPQF